MKRRIRASATTRKQLEDLFAGRGGGTSERSDLVKLATRLILEEVLESSVYFTNIPSQRLAKGRWSIRDFEDLLKGIYGGG